MNADLWDFLWWRSVDGGMDTVNLIGKRIKNPYNIKSWD